MHEYISASTLGSRENAGGVLVAADGPCFAVTRAMPTPYESGIQDVSGPNRTTAHAPRLGAWAVAAATNDGR